jgi:hypothetical protein
VGDRSRARRHPLRRAPERRLRNARWGRSSRSSTPRRSSRW